MHKSSLLSCIMTSVLGPVPILEPLTRDELYLYLDLALSMT